MYPIRFSHPYHFPIPIHFGCWDYVTLTNSIMLIQHKICFIFYVQVTCDIFRITAEVCLIEILLESFTPLPHIFSSMDVALKSLALLEIHCMYTLDERGSCRSGVLRHQLCNHRPLDNCRTHAEHKMNSTFSAK